MTIPTPNLDDRTFDELVHAARERIEAVCPEWSDFSPGEPGRTLVEVFAFLTETLIWRVNRLPERAYHEFLSMMGVRLRPPAAAAAPLRFTRAAAEGEASMPAGTRVLTDRTSGGAGEPAVFMTLAAARFAPGATTAETTAAHCENVEGELLGTGTGRPGQSFRVTRPPIVAPLGFDGDLAVGVELGADEARADDETIRWGSATYVLWREVEDFGNAGPGDRVFVADRASGLVVFAPAARLAAPADSDADGEGEGPLARRSAPLAAAPAEGRSVRAWYRTGGGDAGNVAAGTLVKLDPQRPGITVTNPAAATGGRDAETLANALHRGSRDAAAQGRAVTRRDFEALAESQSHVTRAHADAAAERWCHAEPGTVEVVLTPFLPARDREGPLTRERLEAASTADALDRSRRLLEARRPLGARVDVRWVSYKPVRIRIRAKLRPFVRREEVADRLRRALDRLISPLPDPAAPADRGWPFGQPLRSWHINDVARREPGIDYLEEPVIETDEAPDSVVSSLAADRFQPGFWYAAAGDALYRSVNDGDGWELCRRFPGAAVERVATPAPWQPAAMRGLVALVTRSEAGGGAFHVSRDCGESWALVQRFGAEAWVRDLDFIMRESGPAILFTGADGLREFELARDRQWRQILVDPETPGLALEAVTVARNPSTGYSVFVSAANRGLLCSPRDGLPDSFRDIGPDGFRTALFGVLETHVYAGRPTVWAGVRSPVEVEGEGCFEFTVPGDDRRPSVRRYNKGWGRESCRGLAFFGDFVLAATHRGGVQVLSLTDDDPHWEPSPVGCGLPLRRRDALQPVQVIAAHGRTVMAGPDRQGDGEGGGVYRSTDGRSFRHCSQRQHRGLVTLPPNWLFCSTGEHVVEEPDDAR
jgi:hypothetical protein